jgi:nuclear pore complex protein Nup98-Nup96
LQAVKALLARHPEVTETEEAFLVDKLQVPQTWLYEAKANQLASAGDAYRQYYTLIDAGLPNQAHRVLLDKLAIEASARGDLALLKRLCEALNGNQPEGWEYGGRLFLDYLAVVDEVPTLLVNHLRSGGQADPVDADRLARLISTAQRVLSLLPALFPKKDDVQQFAALSDLLSDVTQIVSQLNAAGLMNKPQVPSVLVNTDRLHLLQQSGLRAFDQNIRALPSAA